MTRDDVDILESDTVWQGFFRVERLRLRHRLFGGGWGRPVVREVFERGQAAAILPYDPERDEVVLIEQFRVGALVAGVNPWITEIVAGIVETGETPEDVVRRELLEEAGCTATDMVPVMDVFTTPGGSSERVAIFCGRVDSEGVGGVHGLDEESEDIRVFTETLDIALRRITDGTITNIIAVAALQWLAVHRNTIRARWLD